MKKRAIILFLVIANYAYGQEDVDFSKAIESIFTTKSSDFFGDFEEVTSPKSIGFGATEKCGEGSDKGVHMCVPYYNCDVKTKTIISSEDYDGSGLIDIRYFLIILLTDLIPSC